MCGQSKKTADFDVISLVPLVTCGAARKNGFNCQSWLDRGRHSMTNGGNKTKDMTPKSEQQRIHALQN